ncbi:MAG: sigma-54 dependent transcriptional regulator [Pseudomonadota bacterium]
MRLLIIGHQSSELSAAARIALDAGAKVSLVGSIEQAMATIRKGGGAELAMIDMRFDVARFVSMLATERFALPVVACGIDSDADAAVAAIKAGAQEFVPLPPDAELIAAILEAVVAEKDDILACDPTMKKVIALADQIAASEASVLITGESGVGKEVIATYLHKKSKRSDAPFISINCAAIPDNLLESELFGHEKGAFTGAVARRIGKFEEAQGGTLLLDEISEMDVRLQAKLLRVLQERVVDRLGGRQSIPVDIRILATSNRHLDKAVADGTFREDLLFRLNVVNLKVPPLRDRPMDILLLADHFAKKYAALNSCPDRPLSEGARAEIMNAAWPGNVRELENAIHRAVLLAAGDKIEADAIRLPDGSAMRPAIHTLQAADAQGDDAFAAGTLVGRRVADVERDLIINTLDHCFGNRTHAANILGISIRTLRNKLKTYAQEGVNVPPAGDLRAHG